MAAFASAVEHGYGIELDIHLLKDGSLAVFHDSDLKRITGKEEDTQRDYCQRKSQYDLVAEAVAHALPVAAAVILGAENARTGHGTENAEGQHKIELVCHGNAGHGGGAHGSDHYIVQHVHEVRDAVLYHYGQCQLQKPGEERRGTKSLLYHDNFSLVAVSKNVDKLAGFFVIQLSVYGIKMLVFLGAGDIDHGVIECFAAILTGVATISVHITFGEKV